MIEHFRARGVAYNDRWVYHRSAEGFRIQRPMVLAAKCFYFDDQNDRARVGAPAPIRASRFGSIERGWGRQPLSERPGYISIYIYLYIYMCVCMYVCDCVRMESCKVYLNIAIKGDVGEDFIGNSFGRTLLVADESTQHCACSRCTLALLAPKARER